MTRDNARLFRVVASFWLAAWYCNAPGEVGFIDNFVDAQSHALELPGFGVWLSDPRIGLSIYVAPLAVLASLLWPQRLSRAAAVIMSISSLAACMHLETCNDATFVTALWSALWLVWLAFNAERDDAAFLEVGRGLAHGVIGLVFLGALVGKLTPEYRSGEAFFELYFRHNESWPYPALRASLSTGAYRELATWFSRSSLWAETMLALAPILPTRFVVALGAATMLTMMGAWTFHLFSVLGSLLGLLLAAELLRRRARAITITTKS